MEKDQIILHARKYIEDDGYQKYDFDTILKTEGTNVWQVVAKVFDGKIELLINDIDGSLLNKTRHKVVVINETVSITESVSVGATLHFDLKEKIFIGGKLIDSNEIELIPDSDPKYLKGFKIFVKNLTEKTSNDAYELASRFTNYLSVITGLVVEHKRPITRIKSGSKTTNTITFSVDAVLVKVQDLDLQKLATFLNADSRIHQHLYQAKKGLEALLNNDFAQAIRWFYMIIENDGSTDSKKYLPLRNVVSHEELDKDSTVSGVLIFGIAMNKGDHLNFNDPQIQIILQREANNLYNIVRPIIENEIK